MEVISSPYKFPAQVEIIVYFAIEDNAYAVLSPHGLTAFFNVNDTKSFNTKAETIRSPGAAVIGAAMNHGRDHPGDRRQAFIPGKISDRPSYSTHQVKPPSYCAYTLEYCGDGVINGPEECDDGGSNGEMCTPSCPNSCEYCSMDCKIAVSRCVTPPIYKPRDMIM